MRPPSLCDSWPEVTLPCLPPDAAGRPNALPELSTGATSPPLWLIPRSGCADFAARMLSRAFCRAAESAGCSCFVLPSA